MRAPYLHQVEKCLVCGGDTRRGSTTLEYDFGDLKITVMDVPAAICAECGESYVPGNAGVTIGDAVAELAADLRSILSSHGELVAQRLETTYHGSLESRGSRSRDWVTV